MVALLAAAGVAGAQVTAPLRPDEGRLAGAPAALRQGLREDPFTYFRFLNTDWAARVCEAFREDLPSLPTAIIQGDAHLEQYALTATAHGLDDFDDAAHGPSAIDLVRFLGSVDLVARRRGWAAERERLFDRFFDGYARALVDPAYQPPAPEVVARLPARPRKTREQFLAWAFGLAFGPELLPPNSGASFASDATSDPSGFGSYFGAPLPGRFTGEPPHAVVWGIRDEPVPVGYVQVFDLPLDAKNPVQVEAKWTHGRFTFWFVSGDRFYFAIRRAGTWSEFRVIELSATTGPSAARRLVTDMLRSTP